MFIMENSTEILRLAGAVAILGLGVAGTWFLVYMALMMKRVYHVVRMVEVVVAKVDEYVAKPIQAVSGVIDDVAPILKFFAGRRRD